MRMMRKDDTRFLLTYSTRTRVQSVYHYRA